MQETLQHADAATAALRSRARRAMGHGRTGPTGVAQTAQQQLRIRSASQLLLVADSLGDTSVSNRVSIKSVEYCNRYMTRHQQDIYCSCS